MEIISIKDQPDGSALLELEMTDEEQNFFIETGVIHCLREKIKECERDLLMEQKSIKIGLCLLDEGNKPISSKILEANWSKDIKNELKEKFNVEMEKEISLILCEKIKQGITEEVVYDLLKGIKNENYICPTVSS